MTCEHCGYDDHGGYFYTTSCDNCREKTRFTYYIAKKKQKDEIK